MATRVATAFGLATLGAMAVEVVLYGSPGLVVTTAVLAAFAALELTYDE
jgi:hypothetical protein